MYHTKSSSKTPLIASGWGYNKPYASRTAPYCQLLPKSTSDLVDSDDTIVSSPYMHLPEFQPFPNFDSFPKTWSSSKNFGFSVP